MDIVQKIKALAEAKLKDPAHFIVDVVASKHKPLKVNIIVDGDQGIGIEDCSALSRALSDELDKTNLIADNFTLEIGTPGLDQPLKLHRQYVKNIGRNVRVHHTEKQLTQGQLKNVTKTKISVEAEVKSKGKKKELKLIEIPFNEIEKTLVIVSFK